MLRKDFKGNITIDYLIDCFVLNNKKRKATVQFHIIIIIGRKYRRKIFANQYRRQI